MAVTVMTKIIGHRGAAGIALENTRESLLAAIKCGVDVVELDTHLTADDHLVVIHDPTTQRIAPITVTVHSKTLAELQTIKLNNGETLLSLDEALDVIGSVPVIIELKSHRSVDELLLVLARHPDINASVASFLHSELRKVRSALPNIPIYVLEHFSPLEIIQSARRLHATGFGLNKGLINPLTYRLAKRYNLEMYVYSVNNSFMAWFMRLLYPDLDLCTDHPERLVKSRRAAKKR